MNDDIENKKPPLARDTATVIAAEQLYAQFRELTTAGFTPHEAINYLGTLIATLTFLNMQRRDLDRGKKNE
jgi:hypothetical protein